MVLASTCDLERVPVAVPLFRRCSRVSKWIFFRYSQLPFKPLVFCLFVLGFLCLRAGESVHLSVTFFPSAGHQIEVKFQILPCLVSPAFLSVVPLSFVEQKLFSQLSVLQKEFVYI